ncbi:MAG: hypothetical protein ACM3YE_11380 [Bacteroidota bacterium]
MTHIFLSKKLAAWLSQVLAPSVADNYAEFTARFSPDERQQLNELYLNEVDNIILKMSRADEPELASKIFESSSPLCQSLIYDRCKKVLSFYTSIERDHQTIENHPNALLASALLVDWYSLSIFNKK